MISLKITILIASPSSLVRMAEATAIFAQCDPHSAKQMQPSNK